MVSAMKPSPMPLFNYRKRERHALVSDPQKISSPNVPSETGSEDASVSLASKTPSSAIKNENKFDKHNFKSVSYTNANSHSSFKDNNDNCKSQPTFTRNMSYNTATSTYKMKPSPSLPKVPALMSHKAGANNRRVALGKDPSIVNEGSKRNTSALPNQTLTAKTIMPTSTIRGSFQGRGQSSRPSSGSSRGFHAQGQGRGGWNKNTHSSGSFSSSSNDFSSGSTSGYCSSSADPWPNTPHAQNSWNSQGTQARKPNNSVKLQSDNSHFEINNYNSNSQFKLSLSNMHTTSFGENDFTSSKQSTNVKNTPFSIFDEEDVILQPIKDQIPSVTPMDTSLRIFTCPIKDLQSWSHVRLLDGPVLFEVYGLIISGPKDIVSGLGKEFYIRDQSDTLKCIFYEIDRELPSVIRGQVHRIIGSFDSGQSGGYLKVVSVRKASKEERQTCQEATEVSLNEMNRLASVLDKEP